MGEIFFGRGGRGMSHLLFFTEITPFMFVAGGGIALAIALATISYHTIRSASENPVKALRHE